MKNEKWLSMIQLKRLRQDIILNSLYLDDYNNRYDIDKKLVSDFFDSYLDYLQELMQEDNINDNKFFDYLSVYDTTDNLYDWYCCYEYDPLIRS